MIIGGWGLTVDIKKLIKITQAIHVTLKFHLLVALLIFFTADFTQGAKTTFCKPVLDNYTIISQHYAWYPRHSIPNV
jgi:hypothetical protein